MEVNRHLAALAESWERGGFPMHMNLAVRNSANTAATVPIERHDNGGTNFLKQQNRQLNDEVTQKRDRIAVLERERLSLIRELVKNQRSKINYSNDNEAIF